jgi:hypothetical protein
MRVPSRLILLGTVFILPGLALAQTPVKPPASDTDKPAVSGRPSGEPSNDPCAQGHATVGAGNEIVTPNAKQDGKTLSDHLAQSGGVICPPPAVDPAIRAPTPESGRMPVIPPPGTPGGDQSVKPK